MPTDIVMITVNCASVKEAELISGYLLKTRLVACANILPGVRSRFWWKGKIDHANEAMLVMKTRRVNFKAVLKEVKRLHSYEVPEIIALPIMDSSPEYLKWVKTNTK
jgi:periplasmic divalent cation tolerance protein